MFHLYSMKSIIQGNQGRNLEPASEAETMEECCLLLAHHDLFNLLVLFEFFGWFFFFVCLFLKQGFLCIALAVLELTLSTRLALNSLCFPSARIKGICHHHPTQTAFLQHPDLQPRGGTILSELDPLTSITNQENAPPAKLVGAFS